MPLPRGRGAPFAEGGVDVCRWSHLGCLQRHPDRSGRGCRSGGSADLRILVQLCRRSPACTVPPVPVGRTGPCAWPSRSAWRWSPPSGWSACRRRRPRRPPCGPPRWSAACSPSSAARATGSRTARQTELAKDATGTTYSAVFSVPAGDVGVQGRAQRLLGRELRAGRHQGRPTARSCSPAPAELRVVYDDTTHKTTLTPTDLGGDRVTAADRRLATDSLRNGLTRERFYFVMADRFANGSTANDRGGLTGDRLATGYDPTDKGFYHGGDLKGVTDKLDYIKGLGTTVDLADAVVQEPPGAGQRRRRQRRLPRLLDHRLHPDRPAPRHQRRHEDPDRQGPRQGHEGLLRHHHQPHRRRDRLRPTRRPYTYIEQGQTAPYKDADGNAFDDRDYADKDTFPALDPATSFPYKPVFDAPADETVKVPAWLNDPTLYHNRGDSTFTGENSDLRRLLRSGRPVHREPEVVTGHGGHLQGLGRPRHRRLPDRHRQAREPGVLAAVLAGRAGARRGSGATTTSSCSARSTTPTRRT